MTINRYQIHEARNPSRPRFPTPTISRNSISTSKENFKKSLQFSAKKTKTQSRNQKKKKKITNVRDGNEWNLASDDGNGRKSFPEGHSLAAMVAQDGASSLDSVDEADQALHCRHFWDQDLRIYWSNSLEMEIKCDKRFVWAGSRRENMRSGKLELGFQDIDDVNFRWEIESVR